MLAPTLPDLSQLDREELQALLLAEHQGRLATHQQLLQRESEIEHLKLLLNQLRRMQFGPKSEKLGRQIEQVELRLEDLQQAQAAEQTAHWIESASLLAVAPRPREFLEQAGSPISCTERVFFVYRIVERLSLSSLCARKISFEYFPEVSPEVGL